MKRLDYFTAGPPTLRTDTGQLPWSCVENYAKQTIVAMEHY